MKICPHCKSEVENNFEVCWNCQYSFTEKKIVEFISEEDKEHYRLINCLRCPEVPMVYTGVFRFHEGSNYGVLGNIFEAFENKESFEIYLCPRCGKAEFFTPL
jgi:Zn finger protein HypA/HybF involved in hydrogenase expression